MGAILTGLLAYMRQRAQRLAVSNIALIAIPLLVLVIIGTVGYATLEGWSILDALYATIITITTVGYGDLTPQTPAGRLFSIVFTLSAIGMASYAISTLAATVIEKQSRRVERRIWERRMQRITDLNEHIIICGASIVGHRFGSELIKRGTPFVLIEADEDALRRALLWMNPTYIAKLRRQFASMEDTNFDAHHSQSVGELAEEIGILYLQSDPMEESTLLRAGIAKAAGVVTAMKDDRDNISLILSARDMQGKLNNEALRIVSLANEEQNIRRIYLAGADKVTAPNFVGSLQMVDHMLSPRVGEMWDQMLFNTETLFRFTEWHIGDHPEWIGRTVDELRQERQQTVIAIHRDNTYLYTPAPDTILTKIDIVIVVGAAA